MADFAARVHRIRRFALSVLLQFIDLEELKALGLLTEEELSGERHCGDEGKIDYGHIYESREKLLRLAHRRFRESLNGSESVGEDAVRRTKDRATYQAAVAALHPENTASTAPSKTPRAVRAISSGRPP